MNQLPPENFHHIFSYLDYFRDVFRHKRFAVPDFSCISDWSIDDYSSMMDLDRSEEFTFDEEPLCLTCKSFYEAFVSYQPIEIKIQMINGDYKHWARYYCDKSYLKCLTLIPVDKQYEEMNLKDRDYVPKYLERIKTRYENIFDRVEYITCFAPVGKNYWSFQGVNYPLKKIFQNMKCLVSNYELSQVTTKKHLNRGNNFISSVIYVNKYGNLYFPEHKDIEDLKNLSKLMGKRSFHVEVILAHAIINERYATCKLIISNFDFDIGYFQHLWNMVLSNIVRIDIEIIEILQLIHCRYSHFKVFISRLESLYQLEMIEKFPFILADKKRCLSFGLIDCLKDVDKINNIDINEYFNNTDFNKIGKYGFSPLSSGIESFHSCVLETQDAFGVAPFMHKNFKNIPLSKECIMMKDNYGNNYLHYLFSQEGFSERIPNEFFVKLEQEENKFGLSAAELGVANGCIFLDFQPFTKKFNYKGLEIIDDKEYAKFKLLDGLEVNLAILYATHSGIAHPNTDYSIYQDINYRDANGKHLIHYFPNYYNCTKVLPNLTEEEILLTPDQNGSMLLHTSIDNYTQILYSIALWKESPTINISGYFDKLGFNRIMYYILKTNIDKTRELIEEANVIGFDYSNENDPKIVHLTVQKKDDNMYFEMERTSIPRITGGFQWFGGEEGDEISHFLIRSIKPLILQQHYSYFSNVIDSLIRKGLKFDVVKNFQGKTALDLLNEFKERNPNIESDIYTQINKGTTKKSLAQAKFKIKASKCPADLIISQTDNSLVVKDSFLPAHFVSIDMKLYFDKKVTIR